MKIQISKERMTYDDAVAFVKRNKGRLLTITELNAESKVNDKLLQVLQGDRVWTSETDYKLHPVALDVGYYNIWFRYVDADGWPDDDARVAWVKLEAKSVKTIPNKTNEEIINKPRHIFIKNNLGSLALAKAEQESARRYTHSILNDMLTEARTAGREELISNVKSGAMPSDLLEALSKFNKAIREEACQEQFRRDTDERIKSINQAKQEQLEEDIKVLETERMKHEQETNQRERNVM